MRLGIMQRENVIPSPPPGTSLTTVLLTSAASSKYNNKPGKVVAPSEGTVLKQLWGGYLSTLADSRMPATQHSLIQQVFETVQSAYTGRVAVLLDGTRTALAFNVKNLFV